MLPDAMHKRPVAVITGASAGVGRATAREFARQGYAVALLARGRDGLEAAAHEVAELGGRPLILQVDVSDHRQIDAAARSVVDEFGQIDVWVNNAFAGILSPFVDIEPDEFRRVVDVTFMGQVHGTRAALQHMLPRNSGTVVLVGSALAYRGIPLQSAYCASKHALQGFQDSVRSELLHRKSAVRLTMVQLPGVNTPQFEWVRTRVDGRPMPVGAVYQPEVAARAIWHAARLGRKQFIVGAPSWQAIIADKFISPLLDRYLAATAVEGQQDARQVRPDRADNLFEPVSGDHGAHGRFGAIARQRSLLLWASMNRAPIGAAIAAGAVLLFAAHTKGRKMGGLNP